MGGVSSPTIDSWQEQGQTCAQEPILKKASLDSRHNWEEKVHLQAMSDTYHGGTPSSVGLHSEYTVLL